MKIISLGEFLGVLGSLIKRIQMAEGEKSFFLFCFSWYLHVDFFLYLVFMNTAFGIGIGTGN